MAKQKPFELAYPVEWYTPYGISNLTDKQLRDEYTRMRDAARKSVKRLNESEFSHTEVAKQYGKGFAELRTLTVKTSKQASPEERAIAQAATRRNIESEFMRMSVYMRSPELHLAGLRKRRAQNIKMLRAHGYYVTVNNYRRFTEFMEYARQRYGAKLYDSTQTVDIFGAAERAGLSFEAMDKMLERYHEGGEEGARQVANITAVKSAREIRLKFAEAFGLQQTAKALYEGRKK